MSKNRRHWLFWHLFFWGLCVVMLFWRVEGPALGIPPNFSPTMALALAGGLWFRSRRSMVVLFCCVLLADVLLNLRYGMSPVTTMTFLSLLCYGACWWMGGILGELVPWSRMLISGFACSLLFYVVSNTASWALSGDYLKSYSGWVQALTVGLPGYPPTWQFFASSLVGDLGFLSVIKAVRYAFCGVLRQHRFEPVGRCVN